MKKVFALFTRDTRIVFAYCAYTRTHSKHIEETSFSLNFGKFVVCVVYGTSYGIKSFAPNHTIYMVLDVVLALFPIAFDYGLRIENKSAVVVRNQSQRIFFYDKTSMGK